MTKKLWVAVPAYTGQITVETAHCLNVEIYEAFAKNWGYIVQFYQQNPMIHYARNLMCRLFLESDYSDMIFVDSDVGWPSGTLCKLAEYPVDIVGAVYPHRNDPMTFPVRYIGERTELRGGDGPGTESLLEVEGIPAGCMRITRNALETIMAKFPEDVYNDMTGNRTHSFFQFSSTRGEYLGEDWHFCRTARDAGLKIWCDPEIDMTHTGTKVYRGNLGQHLRSRGDPQQMMDNIMQFVGQEAA